VRRSLTASYTEKVIALETIALATVGARPYTTVRGMLSLSDEKAVLTTHYITLYKPRTPSSDNVVYRQFQTPVYLGTELDGSTVFCSTCICNLFFTVSAWWQVKYYSELQIQQKSYLVDILATWIIHLLLRRQCPFWLK
jgi:hypothetical protein